MSARRSSLRLGATALLAGAALTVSTASAGAGALVASAPSCDDQALSKVFSPWLDYADYTPLSGGNFENGARGWSLTGGAATAAGNSPYNVGGAGDAMSLSLPAGSSATSASICVGIRHPTLRFFAKRGSGAAGSTLAVEVLYESASGSIESLRIGSVLSNGSWQPTQLMSIVANLLALFPDENTPVAFRFIPQGAGWSIDDIWVDPYHRH